MSFFSLLAVLLLEHFRPLTHRLKIYFQFTRYAILLERHFNAGEHRHGAIAWLLAVLPPVIIAALGGYLLGRINPLFALVWNGAVLYVTLSFKYFGAIATRISEALRDQKTEQAAQLLGDWQGRSLAGLETRDIVRLTIEQTLGCAHRQLFGVMTWFVLLGPGGAVLYRLALILNQKWAGLEESEFGKFGLFAAKAFDVLDWIPERLTAISFAIVGDFEDAIYCWRTQAGQWLNEASGVVLAAGAGALGVRLGEPLHFPGNLEIRPELGLGEEADVDYIDSAMSMIWRALVLWLGLILLLTLAEWIGT
jgi:adenosylcobinamide-phosphate synthase